MISIGPGFTPLEQAVLHAVWTNYPADQASLEAQLATATRVTRRNTGAGFYTDFHVERILGAALGGERLRNGPLCADVEGLEHGMGFILWLEEGYASCIEGYSFVDDTTDLDLHRATFTMKLHESQSSGTAALLPGDDS